MPSLLEILRQRQQQIREGLAALLDPVGGDPRQLPAQQRDAYQRMVADQRDVDGHIEQAESREQAERRAAAVRRPSPQVPASRS